MSRAFNLDVSQADVTAMCAHHGLTISAIEPLQDGGTRVVLTNMAAAAVIARVFEAKIITGAVRRIAFFRQG
jgi:hypothetical protein